MLCVETGIKQEVKIDIASTEVYCRQGLEEAEQMGEFEMQAEFLYLGTQLHIINGKPIHKVILILKVICILLIAVVYDSHFFKHWQFYDFFLQVIAAAMAVPFADN